MAETYFITGAQGCIGSWIVKALAERDDAPVVFDRSADRRRLEAIMRPEDLDRVRFVSGDITMSPRCVPRSRHQAHAGSSISQVCKFRRAKLIPSLGPL